MTPPSPDTEPPLRHRLRVLQRRKGIVILTFVLVVAAAAVFTVRQKRMYTATAQVVLSNRNLAAALTNTEQFTGVTVTPTYLAQTQADVARSPQLARLTLDAVTLHESPTTFLSNSTVSPLSDADVLVFSVSDHDPTRAQSLAAAYAQEYVSYSQGIAAGGLVRARQELKRTLSANPSNKGLRTQLLAKDQQLATLQALSTSAATVVNTGSPAVLTQPKTLRTLIVGVAVGLVLAIGLAFFWDALDTRLRTGEQIEESLDAPLLGSLSAPPRRMYERDQVATLEDPGSASAESFRILRTQVDLARLGSDYRTIMVTSCVAGEGKSTTVANLAVAMASAGHRVVAVDLDIHGRRLERFMAPRGAAAGLTEVALGEVDLSDALIPAPVASAVSDGMIHLRPADRSTPQPNSELETAATGGPSTDTAVDEPLMFLPAGVSPPNQHEFASSPAVGLVLAALRARFDTVLIDTPPALSVGDALALSQHVDAIIVIARVDLVKRSLLKQLKRSLDASPARTMGVIVTGVRTQALAYYSERATPRDAPK